MHGDMQSWVVGECESCGGPTSTGPPNTCQGSSDSRIVEVILVLQVGYCLDTALWVAEVK